MTTRSNTPGQGPQGKALLAWQLALLRFALTRDGADRMALLAIAGQLDAPGCHSSTRPAFKFFHQASVALCQAIVDPQHPGGRAVLRQHVNRSEGERLKRVLATAFAIDMSEAKPPPAPSRPNHDLWRGLQPHGRRKRA